MVVCGSHTVVGMVVVVMVESDTATAEHNLYGVEGSSKALVHALR